METAPPSIGEQIQQHRTAAVDESWAVVRRLVNERELSPDDVGDLSDALKTLDVEPPATANVEWSDFAQRWLSSMRQVLETHATCGEALDAEPKLLKALRECQKKKTDAHEKYLAAMTANSAAFEEHRVAESALNRVANQRGSMRALEVRYPALFSEADDASEGDKA